MEFSKVPADHRSTDLKTYGMVNRMWFVRPGEEKLGTVLGWEGAQLSGRGGVLRANERREGAG